MYNGSTKFTDVRAKLCMCCRMSGHSKILISASAGSEVILRYFQTSTECNWNQSPFCFHQSKGLRPVSSSHSLCAKILNILFRMWWSVYLLLLCFIMPRIVESPLACKRHENLTLSPIHSHQEWVYGFSGLEW